MFNKILFVLLLITVFALGALSIREYDQYKTEQQQRQQQIVNEQIQANQAEALRQQLVEEEVQRLKADCLLGLEAYNELTELEQSQTTAPSCGLEIVE